MATTQKLLTPAQVNRLKKLAALDSLYNKRATALLAIHAGSSHADAANQAELTLSQVKYWLNKFRRDGIHAFPQTTATEPADIEKTGKVKKTTKDKKTKDKDKKKTKDKKQSKKKKTGKNNKRSKKKDNNKSKGNSKKKTKK